MSNNVMIVSTDNGVFMVTDCGGCDGNKPHPASGRLVICHLCNATGKLTTKIG